MIRELHISRETTQKVVEELHSILSFASYQTLRTVKEILLRHTIEVDSSVLLEISDAIVETNPLLVTTSEKGCLSTDYRRNLYFQEEFSIIEPTEYLFNSAHKNSFVYISVPKVLSSLLEREDFSEQVVVGQDSLPGVYKSSQDRKHFKDNTLLGQQNKCISLALYTDDFEICNPLGTSKMIYKVTAVYWVVLNLPAKFRASLTSIQLALLGRSEDVKEYGYESFLEPLIKDIQQLEEEGLFVQVLDQFVKGIVFCVCADNLAAHSLAGFSQSFNVEKFCRFCLISKDQIATTDVEDIQLRTVDGHNAVLQKLRQNETLKSIDGVKNECVLEKHLQFFHTINGFPPDILHDFFEGVIPYELCLCHIGCNEYQH